METYNSPTHGKLQRCWCWTEGTAKERDNGWRPETEDYPHSRNCRVESNHYVQASRLFWQLHNDTWSTVDARFSDKVIRMAMYCSTRAMEEGI